MGGGSPLRNIRFYLLSKLAASGPSLRPNKDEPRYKERWRSPPEVMRTGLRVLNEVAQRTPQAKRENYEENNSADFGARRRIAPQFGLLFCRHWMVGRLHGSWSVATERRFNKQMIGEAAYNNYAFSRWTSDFDTSMIWGVNVKALTSEASETRFWIEDWR